MLCHVYKVRNSLAPGYMMENLAGQNTVHSHNTRLSQKGGYGLPKVKGSGAKSFNFIGAKLWNSLPNNVTTIENVSSFKVAVKSLLLNKISS